MPSKRPQLKYFIIEWEVTSFSKIMSGSRFSQRFILSTALPCLLFWVITNSVHMHKMTNLWKFELNWLSKLRENNGKKNTLVAQVGCFQMPWIRDLSWGLQFNSNILVRNYLFSQKLCYLRGNRFSQFFILSTALHCSLPSNFFYNNYFV